ncbi:MAG: class I SAM-dependent methyltransferase [Acidimicrobiales bacterium]|nr:class I SAM-dependent methyltransferase [Acidimicrobiales bacterium]
MTPRPSGTPYARHPELAWTSFDRFGRYAALTANLRELLDDDAALIVDVGDSSGYLRRFLPEVPSVAFDIGIEDQPFDDRVFTVADGLALPLADGAATAVACSDVLEHVRPDARAGLLAELTRVSQRGVVVAAPFDTFGVAGVESIVARYAATLLGNRQPQLAEHEDNGLPDLAATVDAFVQRGWDVRVRGEGNLHDWLGVMLLRFGTETREELRPLGDGVDIVYNHMLSARTDVGPYYRHVLEATPAKGTPTVVGLEESLDPPGADPDSVGSAFIGQLGLLGLVPRLEQLKGTTAALDRLHVDLADVVQRQDAALARLDAVESLLRLDAVESRLHGIDARLADVGERTFYSTITRWLRRLTGRRKSTPEA